MRKAPLYLLLTLVFLVLATGWFSPPVVGARQLAVASKRYQVEISHLDWSYWLEISASQAEISATSTPPINYNSTSQCTH
ncbi:hypothetical protein Cni_G15505 [Canna indica]|uniref:Uncharacterized protein n=1 Tax=Canna indica TaxID=4628 RepID=A0AAQ3QBM8_9LILI|nr:hypothetical protein Cni_G15505 [Canna indica]